MKFTALLTIIVLLASCGGGSSSTTTSIPLDPEKIHIKIVKSTGNYGYDGPPLEGVVVQLDHDGENRTSDKTGIVTFSISDSLEHDIHVFGQNGFIWESIYGVKKGVLNKIQLHNPDDIAPRPQDQQSKGTSYISFSGTILNFNPDSSYSFIFYNRQTGKEYSGKRSANAVKPGEDYQTTFQLSLPVGTSVTGEILVMESSINSLNSEIVLVDSVTIALNTYITNATVDNNKTQNITMLGSMNKVPKTDIITISNMNIAKQLSFNFLYLYQRFSFESIDTFKPWVPLYEKTSASLTFPKTFQSYTPYDYSRVGFMASADNESVTARLRWSISGQVDRYATVNIDPIITVFPAFPEIQSGPIISWGSVDDNLSYLYLSITESSNTIGSMRWNINLQKNATMIKLPLIPSNIKPILTQKENYIITIGGGSKGVNVSERFRVRYSGWTL